MFGDLDWPVNASRWFVSISWASCGANDEDDRGDVNNWSCKTCKAPVKMSPSTNQHPVFLQAGCPSCRPTNSVRALKGIARSLYKKLSWCWQTRATRYIMVSVGLRCKQKSRKWLDLNPYVACYQAFYNHWATWSMDKCVINHIKMYFWRWNRIFQFL